MELKDILSTDDKLRIIQELVPGKQITLAHVIASPDPILYTKLGLNPEIDFGRSAIGILTMSPAETAIIAADLATKTSKFYSLIVPFFQRYTYNYRYGCGR